MFLSRFSIAALIRIPNENSQILFIISIHLFAHDRTRCYSFYKYLLFTYVGVLEHMRACVRVAFAQINFSIYLSVII